MTNTMYTDAEVELLRQDDEQEGRSMQMLAGVAALALLVGVAVLFVYLMGAL